MESVKRKRSPSDAVPVPSITGGSHQTANNVTTINYFIKEREKTMRLIAADQDTFSDILGLIDGYEAVLQRQESLAANLGVKMLGPLLIKSLEKMFDNPIRILVPPPDSPEPVSVSWLDVLNFAHNNPREFHLSPEEDEPRGCQFWIKQTYVRISENDYRLITSGAPNRMIPSQPIAEDEVSELGILDILEQRLAVLVKKADSVAGRARHLNYHLKGRRSMINNRRSSLGSLAANAIPDERTPQRTPLVSDAGSSQRHEQQSSQVHQDLLRQISSNDKRTYATPSRPKPARTTSETPHVASFTACNDARPKSHSSTPKDGDVDWIQSRMIVRAEKLDRGEGIAPPCDRCRRLKLSCTKHLMACVGCTKKHAKCRWRDLTPQEIADLKKTPEVSTSSQPIDEGGPSREAFVSDADLYNGD